MQRCMAVLGNGHRAGPPASPRILGSHRRHRGTVGEDPSALITSRVSSANLSYDPRFTLIARRSSMAAYASVTTGSGSSRVDGGLGSRTMPRVSCRAGIENSSRDQVLTSPGRTDERADAMTPAHSGSDVVAVMWEPPSDC